MAFYRMLLPDGSVHAEAELASSAEAGDWARSERGQRSGMLGYQIEEWDGDRWVFRESSEIHSGTPQYVFGKGPQDPPSGLTDQRADLRKDRRPGVTRDHKCAGLPEAHAADRHACRRLMHRPRQGPKKRLPVCVSGWLVR